MRRLFCGSGFVCLMMALGCGPAAHVPPPVYDVTGTVTLDGKPLAKGNIMFLPLAVDGFPPASAEIKDGAFSTKVRAGKLRVEIRSLQDSGKKRSTGDPELVDVLPAHYNTDSKLTADISDTGPNSLKFELKK